MKRPQTLLALLLVTLLLPLNLFAAQPAATATGEIVDSLGRGVPYPYVALLNIDNRVVRTVVADANGRFEIGGIAQGRYTFSISSLGYTTKNITVDVASKVLNLGRIAIDEGVAIDDVVVTGQRQYVSSKVDRLVYDVASDPAAATKSATELLSTMPFITVDKVTGKVQAFGKDVAFTVNGKESVLLSNSNQEYLTKVLKGANLKQLELVTSPDGKLVNSGAVINLDTRSSLPDGFAGTINADADTSSSVQAGAALTSKIGRLIYNIGYTYSYADKFGSETFTSREDYVSDTYRFVESYNRSNPVAANTHNALLNASYDITPKDLLTVKFNANVDDNLTDIFSRSTYKDASQAEVLKSGSHSRNTTDNAIYNAAINYQRSFDKPGRLLTVQYGYNDIRNKFLYNLSAQTDGTQAVQAVTRNKLGNTEHTAGVDFYNPISRSQSYFVTAKYVYRDYTSNAFAEADATELSRLNYTQQVASLSGNYTIRTRKVQLTAQAAFEHVADNIDFGHGQPRVNKDDNSLLVSLRTTYMPAPGHSLMLDLSKSAFRPDISYLNPYEDRSVTGVISKGNPDLNNERQFSAMLLYRYYIGMKFSIRPMITFHYSDNGVYAYNSVGNDGIITRTFDNIGKANQIRLSTSITYTPTQKLMLSLSAVAARYEFSYADTRNSYWMPNMMFMFNTNLWRGASLGGYIYYMAPNAMLAQDIQQAKVHYQWLTSVTLTQNIGKHLSLSAGVLNLQNNKQKSISEQHSSEFYSYSLSESKARIYSFRVQYTFGRFNEAVKRSNREVTNNDRTKQ